MIVQGASLGTDTIVKHANTGAYVNWSDKAKKQLLFFGCFPGNLQNWSTVFQALVTAGTIQGGYYTVSGIRFSKSRNTQTLYNTSQLP